MADVRLTFAQPIGYRFSRAFRQPLADCKTLSCSFDQYLDDCAQLRGALRQPIGQTAELRAILGQPVSLLRGCIQSLEQPVTIAADPVRSTLRQRFALLAHTPVRTALDQLFVLAADGSIEQQIDTRVMVDGYSVTRIRQISIEDDEDSVYITAELHVPLADDAIRFVPWQSRVEVVTAGISFDFICEACRRTTAMEGDPPTKTEMFVVPLISRTVLLDLPHAEQLEETPSGMAQDVVRELAAGFDLQWDVVDWYIPADTLAATGRTPLDVIRQIAAACGGVVRTTPAGELLVRPEYPVSVPDWPQAAPSLVVTDQDDIARLDAAPSPRDGYNVYYLTDSAEVGDEERVTVETEMVNQTKAAVRVWLVPWQDDCRLHHSGGSWVSIYADGVQITEHTEQVEIVAGEGRLNHPFYRAISHDWRQADLGAVTIADDGAVTTGIDGNSLVSITYSTRFHAFTIVDPRVEDVQVYPETA